MIPIPLDIVKFYAYTKASILVLATLLLGVFWIIWGWEVAILVGVVGFIVLHVMAGDFERTLMDELYKVAALEEEQLLQEADQTAATDTEETSD